MDHEASHLSTHGNRQQDFPIHFFEDYFLAIWYFMRLTLDKNHRTIPKIQLKTEIISIEICTPLLSPRGSGIGRKRQLSLAEFRNGEEVIVIRNWQNWMRAEQRVSVLSSSPETREIANINKLIFRE